MLKDVFNKRVGGSIKVIKMPNFEKKDILKKERIKIINNDKMIIGIKSLYSIIPKSLFE